MTGPKRLLIGMMKLPYLTKRMSSLSNLALQQVTIPKLCGRKLTRWVVELHHTRMDNGTPPSIHVTMDQMATLFVVKCTSRGLLVQIAIMESLAQINIQASVFLEFQARLLIKMSHSKQPLNPQEPQLIGQPPKEQPQQDRLQPQHPNQLLHLTLQNL